MASIYFCVLHDQVIFPKNFSGFSKSADRWLKMAMQSVTALSSYFCHRCVSLEPECPLFSVWCHFHTRLALFLPCSAVATTSLRNDLRYSFHWASGLACAMVLLTTTWDTGQSANIWIWVSSEAITTFNGWSVSRLLYFLQLRTPCWRAPTRSKQLYRVAILGEFSLDSAMSLSR